MVSEVCGQGAFFFLCSKEVGAVLLGDVAVAEEDGVYLRAQVGVERRGGVVGGRGGDLDWR